VDLARLVETRRKSIFQESEEGVDGGEPGVAGTGRVAPVPLKMFEKGEHKPRVEMLYLELSRLDTKAASGEAGQQLEAVGIGIAGVRAGPALGRQMLA
jgi:hypothetical protein